MFDCLSPEVTPLLALYAETHYRFRFFPFSLYYRREPEIIFDAPYRLEPGSPLPVTLIVKDADRYPIKLTIATVKISDGHETTSHEITINADVSASLWHHVFHIDVSNFPPGNLTVDATLTFHNGKRPRTVRNDNHPGLSHAPLMVLKSEHPLPKLPGWYPGELHVHTSYGGDQVEFGAPLEALRETAQAIGLEWVALTDHSYNLDDYEDNYLQDDPDLLKWKKLHEHVEHLNRENHKVTLVPGEEVTCRSAAGRNVHLLVLGNDNFLKGSGDSAQKWFRTRSEHSVAEALNLLSEAAFCTAAHPFAHVPVLERLLVRRGLWQETDLKLPRLDGWQVLNGKDDDGFRRGLEAWKRCLLAGERKYICAGNDAHGNFNRFRLVKLPMIGLHEHRHHIFGRFMTFVKTEGKPTIQSIIAALKRGEAFISSGPALELTPEPYYDSEGGESRQRKLRVHYSSIPEFGAVKTLKIYFAEETDGEQHVELAYGSQIQSNQSYNGEIIVDIPNARYARAELTTNNVKGGEQFAFSNPVWFD